jgi:hypothetical protein
VGSMKLFGITVENDLILSSVADDVAGHPQLPASESFVA